MKDQDAAISVANLIKQTIAMSVVQENLYHMCGRDQSKVGMIEDICEEIIKYNKEAK